MPYRPHRLPFESPPLPLHAPPNASKSPAPRLVVDVWCDMVAMMDRPRLDAFTRDIWRRFEEGDLAALKQAILRRRAELPRP